MNNEFLESLSLDISNLKKSDNSIDLLKKEISQSITNHRSTISNFVAHRYDTPDRLYKAAISNQRRT